MLYCLLALLFGDLPSGPNPRRATCLWHTLMATGMQQAGMPSSAERQRIAGGHAGPADFAALRSDLNAADVALAGEHRKRLLSVATLEQEVRRMGLEPWTSRPDSTRSAGKPRP